MIRVLDARTLRHVTVKESAEAHGTGEEQGQCLTWTAHLQNLSFHSGALPF